MHRRRYFLAWAPASRSYRRQYNDSSPDKHKGNQVGAIEPASNALRAIAVDKNALESETDWQAVENDAIQLIATSSTISIGGSGAADKKLAKKAQWTDNVRTMTKSRLVIFDAARERDDYATLDTGNLLVKPCGACHSAFPVDSR